MLVTKIQRNAYQNCIEISNGTVSVVIEPDCGGRVLEYSINGVDVIYKNPLEDGYLLENGKPPLSNLSPCAGRCDIGPEFLTPPHPVLWLGKWDVKTYDNNSVELISQPDEVTGLQLRRVFTLDNTSSQLTFTQYIKNISKTTKRNFHWSRTFFKGGGVAIAPLNPNSRYPKGYLTYGPGDVINYFPEPDKNLLVGNGLLQITGPTELQKYAMDLDQGWLGYLTTDSILVIKKFDVYPDRVYGEIAGNNMSFWYNGTEMCEVEPIGPMEEILPEMEVSFTEKWFLFHYPYNEGQALDYFEIQNKLLSCL